MMNKEKILDSFSVVPETAKVTAITRDNLLMKVEKALNFWVEDMNRKRVPLIFILALYNFFNAGNALLCVIFN